MTKKMMKHSEYKTMPVVIHRWKTEEGIVEIRRGAYYRFVVDGVIVHTSKFSRVSEWCGEVFSGAYGEYTEVSTND